MYCEHCKERVHVPDERTGLIHVRTDKYACYKTREGKDVRLDTVAKEMSNGEA